jgi:GT2 family glycosyltransferase
MTNSSASIGVIVIGRNEGERLSLALASIPRCDGVHALYVDSGSTDGSAARARAAGVLVLELDPRRPFSAARARREGVELLRSRHPEIEWLQFVDGDCTLEPQWLERGIELLREREDVGIVCGMLSEAAPEASIYNRLSDLQWKMPAGEISACGGIFIIRCDVYERVGGFNPVLLTREEQDLCDRVRAAGHRIVRLNVPMVKHDAALLHFGQWWSRAVWGGYGDALQIAERDGRLSREQFHRIRRYLTYPLLLPILMIAGAVAAWWWTPALVIPVLGFLAYAAQVAGMTRWRLREGDALRDAVAYGVLRLVRRFATTQGFVTYFLRRGRGASRPDPHAGALTCAAAESRT